MIDPTVVLAFIAAAVPGTAALYTSRNARKDNESKAEVAAFQLAKEFYDETLKGYKEELNATKVRLTSAQTDKTFLEMRVGELERRIRTLEKRMNEAGIAPDPPSTNLDDVKDA